MNKEWSEKNKKMQSLIGKKDSFADGIAVLFELREEGKAADNVNSKIIETCDCLRKRIGTGLFLSDDKESYICNS